MHLIVLSQIRLLSPGECQAQTKLKRDVEAFEQEKKMMATVPVADNDILYLNVGGELVSTKRSTLTQVTVVWTRPDAGPSCCLRLAKSCKEFTAPQLC